jgi:hypothetical protein
MSTRAFDAALAAAWGVVAFLLLWLLAYGLAAAHDGPSHVDQFYATWMQPDTGRKHSCCNKLDCAPHATRLRNGVWQVQHKGQWLEIPENKLEHNYADERLTPDGQSHVCIREAYVPVVLCAVLGAGA